MDTIPMHQRLVELLDFADEITGLVQKNEFDKNSYFMTLIYVEDILDKYGLGLASDSAREDGLTEEQVSEIRVLLNTRLEVLRATIRNFSQTYDFDKTISERGKEMLRDWHKL